MWSKRQRGRLVVALLRLGLSPRRAQRLVLEWQDHVHEGADRARQDGATVQQAASDANAALGEEQALLRAVENRPELRSLTARHSWLLLALPLLALILCILLQVLGVISGFGRYLDAGLSVPTWLLSAVKLNYWATSHLLPLVLAGSVAWFAVRRLRTDAWPLVATVVIVVVGSALTLHTEVEQSTGAGSVSVSLALLPPFAGWAAAFERALFGLGLIAAPLLAWQLAERRYLSRCTPAPDQSPTAEP